MGKRLLSSWRRDNTKKEGRKRGRTVEVQRKEKKSLRQKGKEEKKKRTEKGKRIAYRTT